jgi:hypothetical protein
MPESDDLNKSGLCHLSCLVKLHRHETIITHATMSEPIVSHSPFQRHRTIATHATMSEPIVSHLPFQRHETIATHATTSEPIVSHSPFQSETTGPHSISRQSETIGPCSNHHIKRGFKMACLAIFSTFCAYEISNMAVSVHNSHANTKQTVSLVSTFVVSFHRVNTLYDGTVSYFFQYCSV